MKTGDLVQMVRASPCCGDTVGMGHIWVVLGITEPISTTCLRCLAKTTDRIVVVEEDALGGHISARLKVINPPAELECLEEEVAA